MLRTSSFAASSFATLLVLAACGSPGTEPAESPPPERTAKPAPVPSPWEGAYTYETRDTAYLLALGEGKTGAPVGTLEIRRDGEDVIVYDVRGEASDGHIDVVLTAHRNYEGEGLPLGATLFTLENERDGQSGLRTRWGAIQGDEAGAFARVGTE